MHSENTCKPAGWEQLVQIGFIFKLAAVWPHPFLHCDTQDQVQRNKSIMHVEHASSMPYTMMQLRWQQKEDPAHVAEWRYKLNYLWQDTQKRGNGKRRTREIPALLPTPKSENAMFRVVLYCFPLGAFPISPLSKFWPMPPIQPWNPDNICLFSLTPLTASPSHTQGFSQTDQKLCT